MDPDKKFLHRTVQIVRQLHAEPTVAVTAQAVVDLAVSMIDGCDAAGVSLARSRKVTTVACSDAVVARGDRWQYELAEGPCLDAMTTDQVEVTSTHLLGDSRWPRWAPLVVAELGVRSMLSYRLFGATSLVGALNLYSHREDAFTAEDHAEGFILAGQAALALAASDQVENLQIAVARRTTIGQAQGILMERFDLDGEQAFNVLVRLSRDGNRKLYEIADDVVRTRSLPASDRAARAPSAGTGPD